MEDITKNQTVWKLNKSISSSEWLRFSSQETHAILYKFMCCKKQNRVNKTWCHGGQLKEEIKSNLIINCFPLFTWLYPLYFVFFFFFPAKKWWDLMCIYKWCKKTKIGSRKVGTVQTNFKDKIGCKNGALNAHQCSFIKSGCTFFFL